MARIEERLERVEDALEGLLKVGLFGGNCSPLPPPRDGDVDAFVDQIQGLESPLREIVFDLLNYAADVRRRFGYVHEAAAVFLEGQSSMADLEHKMQSDETTLASAETPVDTARHLLEMNK